MEKYLRYDEVALVPNLSSLGHREFADTSVTVEIAGKCTIKSKLPVIPANMECVINSELAHKLSAGGYFYIMHRYGYDGKIFTKYGDNFFTSISVGVDDIPEIERIPDCITIDVAHGWHKKVEDRLKYLKDQFPNTVLIAGNVATFEAAYDLVSWGADIIKVGIGQSNVCTTRLQTGFGLPMFSCVQEVSTGLNVPVIADGGIRYIGDIAKALVAGAKLVMVGSLFAACSDSPAKLNHNGKKLYYGSASFDANRTRFIEGTSTELDIDMPYYDKLQEIKEALQSSISYAGGYDLSSLSPQNVKWRMV